MASREEVEKLKAEWKSDPIWDLYDTEGFEEHREELREYQEYMESVWEDERRQEEEFINHRARELGVEGLYRLIRQHEDIIRRHEIAMEQLAEGKTHEAYRTLRGWAD